MFQMLKHSREETPSKFLQWQVLILHKLYELCVTQATFTRTRFQLKQFHDLETRIENDTVSKSLHGTYLTIKIQPFMSRRSLSQAFCASSIGSRFDQTWVHRLSSPRPNPESLFGFSLRYSAGAYLRKSQHFKTSLPVIAVWLSVYSKIHESSKSEVKPQFKVVIVLQGAAFRARFTIFTSRASQFRARPFSNRCGFAVYTTSKPYPFENAPLLKAYSKWPGSGDNELDRRRVN